LERQKIETRVEITEKGVISRTRVFEEGERGGERGVNLKIMERLVSLSLFKQVGHPNQQLMTIAPWRSSMHAKAADLSSYSYPLRWTRLGNWPMAESNSEKEKKTRW
jgi:hypothetical protein